MRTYVIAEAAATHDGRLDQAHALVELAASIGADAVKFQWCSNPEKLCERRHAPEYLSAYRLLAFPEAWHADLADHAKRAGLDYLCTVYLAEDLAVIAPWVQAFKVAAFEATDRGFIAAALAYGKPVLVSCGMGAASHAGCVPLHCVSAYPTPIDQANLARVRELSGLSDHTRHPWTGGLAVAAGAAFIEFHVRLDDTDPANADYVVARDPREAAEYVANIRTAEAMLGTGAACIMPSEKPYLKYRVLA